MNTKLIEENDEIISKVEDIEHLQKILEIFLSKLERSRELTLKNQFHLGYIVNKILSKCFELVPDLSTNQNVYEFIKVLDELRIFSFAQKIAIQKTYNYTFNQDTDTSYSYTEQQDQFQQEYQDNLDKLINVQNIASNVKFGYALCDLQGNIMWLSSTCEKIIEVGKNRVPNINFFDLMIPFSKNHIKNKFIKNDEDLIEIFNPTKLVDPAIFSFVIYSDKKFQKFQRIIKLKIQKQREVDEIYRSSDSLYHKFLKTVSCKASLVNLKFTPKELKTIEKNRQMLFKMTQCFVDNQIEDFKELNEQQKQQNLSQFQSLAVFLKIRESKKIPIFDYSLMENDDRILQYKYMIQSKIQNQQLINE